MYVLIAVAEEQFVNQSRMSSGCCKNTFERPPLEIKRATFVQIIKALKLPLAYVEAVARHGGIHARVVEAAHHDKSPSTSV